MHYALFCAASIMLASLLFALCPIRWCVCIVFPCVLCALCSILCCVHYVPFCVKCKKFHLKALSVLCALYYILCYPHYASLFAMCILTLDNGHYASLVGTFKSQLVLVHQVQGTYDAFVYIMSHMLDPAFTLLFLICSCFSIL